MNEKMVKSCFRGKMSYLVTLVEDWCRSSYSVDDSSSFVAVELKVSLTHAKYLRDLNYHTDSVTVCMLGMKLAVTKKEKFNIKLRRMQTTNYIWIRRINFRKFMLRCRLELT